MTPSDLKLLYAQNLSLHSSPSALRKFPERSPAGFLPDAVEGREASVVEVVQRLDTIQHPRIILVMIQP